MYKKPITIGKIFARGKRPAKFYAFLSAVVLMATAGILIERSTMNVNYTTLLSTIAAGSDRTSGHSAPLAPVAARSALCSGPTNCRKSV